MAKYQDIYNSINDVIFIYHANSDEILFVNNRCNDVYGYTPDELIDGGFPLLSAEDKRFDMIKAKAFLRKAAKGKEQIFEWKSKHANGQIFWTEVHLKSIILDDVKRIMAIVRDITDRKLATQTLMRSEQVLKAVNFFSTSLINKNSEEEILWDVVRNCVDIMDFEDVVIYIKNEENLLVQTATFGDAKVKEGEVSKQLILAMGEGIVGSVALSGKGEIVSDLSKDDRYIVDIERRKSEITVPIKYQNQLLGIIDSEHPQKGFYTDLHLEVIETIAALCAIKIIQARSDETVRTSEKRLKSILESSPDLIFVINEEGVYKEIYTVDENLLAAPKEHLIGKNMDGFLPREEVIMFKKVIGRVIETKIPETREYIRLKSDGEKAWFSANIAYFEYQNSPSVILLSRNITENKSAEIEILESQKLLASINENISEGLYRSFVKGGLIYVNQAFADMFGYDSEEEMLNVKSLDLYADTTDRIREKKGRTNVEVEFKRKDGSTFWTLISYIFTIDQNGNEIFDGAIRDISKQKKNAEKLKTLNEELVGQNKELALKEQEMEIFNEELISNRDNLVATLEELSDRNFELDQLVYKTSHDLRAPLRSVLGLTNLYRLEVDSPPNSYVQKIEERIHKMDDFIRSMLDYSKASRLNLKYTEVDLEELINDCLSDLEFLEGFNTVKVIKNISMNGLNAITDGIRMKIIMSNIISNVFKYRNVDTGNSFLKVDIAVSKTDISILIEDNGIGIAKEHLGKVFDMFYRATEKSDGSGLGMYIVKQSVDKLHGEIRVESQEMIGTTFKIEIPNHLNE